MTLKNRYNAVWVVAKTKIRFSKYPVWTEPIYARTYTVSVRPIRVDSETTFINGSGEELFTVKQQSCPIDLQTRKIRKLDTVNYPSDMPLTASVIDEPFIKLNGAFSEADLAYEQRVFVTDIDYSRHTNNVMYIRFILNALSSEFTDRNMITDFEIHYINESCEGQTLKIYKKQNDGALEFLITEGQRDIVRAAMKYRPLQ